MTPKEILKEAFDADIKGLAVALDSDKDLYERVMKHLARLVTVLATKGVITLEELEDIICIKKEEEECQ